MPPSRRNPLGQRIREWLIEKYLLGSGVLSIVITVAIAAVVIIGSIDFFLDREYDRVAAKAAESGETLQRQRVTLRDFFLDTEWRPDWNPPRYGILTLVAGTFWVAVIASLVALPIGLLSAIYLSEYATPQLRRVVKPVLEILAGIPTVVYGFFALYTVTPFLAHFIPGLEQPTNMISGGIVVGIMILPMVTSLSEDAIRAVPRSLREGAYALGANQFEVSTRVAVPAALSGITASFILAISRAIGETMAVSLACGERTARLDEILDPRRGFSTMTGFIASIAKGDIVRDTTAYNSLFAVAGLLFFMTLAMNIFAQRILKRYRQVYQ
jgi:phosphate transport system permease protein